MQDAAGAAARPGWPAWAALVVLAAVFGARTVQAWQARGRATPLDLPGSALVRADEGDVARYTFLARTLRDQHSFLTLPGTDSLYGWGGVDYPGDLNCTENFALLTPAEQGSLVAVGRKCGPVALVYSREAFDFYMDSRAPNTGLLVDFFRQECQPLGEAGGFVLLRCASAGAAAPALTGYARLEQREIDGQRQPTGQILVAAPSALVPADALLVDSQGDPLAPPVPLTARVTTSPSDPANYILTLPDPGVLRARPPESLCLRLRDGQGRRLTTVPFFVPAEIPPGTHRPDGEQ